MQITADIGNTRTKIALFNAGILVEKAIWTDWSAADLVLYGQEVGAGKIIFSSVAQPDGQLIETLSAHFTTIELTHQTRLPFRNLYQTPLTLGKDRLAAVAGAQALFGNNACIVIDCGTCIKYELLTENHEYLGGNIAPGGVMRLKSMHHFTARLPEAPMQMADQEIGYTTETALQNGALLGAVLEMIGFIRVFEDRIRASVRPQSPALIQVILTGGDAAFFLPVLQKHLHLIPKPEQFSVSCQPDLTLYGLNYILDFQTQN